MHLPGCRHAGSMAGSMTGCGRVRGREYDSLTGCGRVRGRDQGVWQGVDGPSRLAGKEASELKRIRRYVNSAIQLYTVHSKYITI